MQSEVLHRELSGPPQNLFSSREMMQIFADHFSKQPAPDALMLTPPA